KLGAPSPKPDAHLLEHMPQAFPVPVSGSGLPRLPFLKLSAIPPADNLQSIHSTSILSHLRVARNRFLRSNSSSSCSSSQVVGFQSTRERERERERERNLINKHRLNLGEEAGRNPLVHRSLAAAAAGPWQGLFTLSSVRPRQSHNKVCTVHH